MALTAKDLKIINSALAFFQAEMEQENPGPMWEIHKEEFGDPLKTIEATRNRVYKEMAKKEACV